MKTFKTIIATAALLAEGCVSAFAQTAKKPSVVIMPFEAKGGIEQEDCEVVTELFASEYVITGAATVVNRDTLSKIQTEQKFQASDWSNSNKTAKLGEALNAQQLVSGQLRLYNGLIFVTVQVQDIKTLAVLAAVSTRIENTMKLIDGIPGICKDIASQTNSSVNGIISSKTNWKLGDKGPGGGTVFYISSADRMIWEYSPEILKTSEERSNYRGGNFSDWVSPSGNITKYLNAYRRYPTLTGGKFIDDGDRAVRSFSY